MTQATFDKMRGAWGFAVGIAGQVVGGAALLDNLLPKKVAIVIVAVSAAILAANGQLVPNGHKDEKL